MKKTLNFRVAMILVLALSIAGMLLLAGCGKDGDGGILGGNDGGILGGNDDVQIYVTKADMPRLQYVEGQALDLSDGRLTIDTNGEISKLPLNDAKITVSGYDASQIGDQKITLQYGDLTTSITVNVKARMVAQNFETQYFVGDNFKKTMGRLNITTDDLKTITVNMSDDKVSIASFDSSVAGMVPVTVQYSDGQNTYSCQFTVTVYEESNVEFVAPVRLQYNSYDQKIDVSGGYLTVTSADSKLTKRVPLTQDMVKGFDPSVATMENRKTPAEQVITVEYLGRSFDYTIQITFKGVSVVQYHAANALSKINWADAKQNGLNEETTAAALDAIQEFYMLSEEQRAMLSDSELQLVVRAGAVATMYSFLNELNKLSQTFTMNAQCNLFFVCASYEQTVADMETLNDLESAINVYADLLRKLEYEFGAMMLDTDMVIADLIYVYSEEDEAKIIQILNHIVTVYSLVDSVPAEWDVEALKACGNDLKLAVMEIYNAGYYRAGSVGYYTGILYNWRQDLFDILYSYFLYGYDNGVEFMQNYMWGSMPMPGLLEDWYQSLVLATKYESYFAEYGATDAYLMDVSPFMYYYFQTLEIVGAIKNSGNQLWVDVYNAYDCDFMTRYYIYSTSCGYLHHAKGMIDSDAFNQLWIQYYMVMKPYGSNQLSAETHKESLVAMFNAFGQLNPTELLGFLSSLNYMYTSAQGGLPMLDCGTEVFYNDFTAILKNYYMTYLNEANKPLFVNLLLAMENYALLNYKETAQNQFNALMRQVMADYLLLSEADRANFDEYAGVCYEKYVVLYNLTNGNTTVTLSAQEQAMFLQLQQDINKFMEAYAYLQTMQQEGQGVSVDLFVVMYALHNKIDRNYRQILNSASKEAINAMFVQNVEVMGMRLTIAQLYYEVDTVATSMMISQMAQIPMEDGRYTTLTVWEMYEDYGIGQLWGDLAELMYQAFFKTDLTMTQNEILTILAQMRNLDAHKTNILAATGLNMTYYRAMNMCLNRVLSEEAVAAQAAEVLMAAESAYIAYTIDNTQQTALDAFLENMARIENILQTLSDADKVYLQAAYEYYLAIYAQMKAAA